MEITEPIQYLYYYTGATVYWLMGVGITLVLFKLFIDRLTIEKNILIDYINYRKNKKDEV